jgi:hypothetical protein
MEFNVNKGIGKPAEFKGLKSQYLFIFAGGLLGLFVVFVVMYMAGVNQWVCIIFGITAALTLIYGTFYLNKGNQILSCFSKRDTYVYENREFSFRGRNYFYAGK